MRYIIAATPAGEPGDITLSASHADIGDELTITGSGFGSSQGTSKVYFGEYANPLGFRPATREAASYVSWSDAQIVVTVPSMSPGHVDYTGTYHPVYVEVGGETTDRANFYIDPVNLVDASNAAGAVLPNSTRTVTTTNYTQTTTRDGNVSFSTTSTYSADDGDHPEYGNYIKGHDILFKDCTFIATDATIDGSDSGVVTLGSYVGGQEDCYNLTFVNCVIQNNTACGGDGDGVNGVKCYHGDDGPSGRWGDWTFCDCSFGTPNTLDGAFERACIEIVEPVGGLTGGASNTNNAFQNLHLAGCNFETAGWIAVSLATYCRTPDFSRDILIEDCTFKGNAGETHWGSSQLEYSGYGLEVRDSDFWQWRSSVFSLEGDATDIGGLSMAGHDCLRYFKNLTVDMTHTYASPAPTSEADIFTIDHQEGAVWDDCDFNTGNASRHIRWATYFGVSGTGFDTCVNEDFSASYIHGHCEGAVPTQAYDYWACWNLNNPEVQYADNVKAWPTLGTRP